jgi:hypothetical protein
VIKVDGALSHCFYVLPRPAFGTLGGHEDQMAPTPDMSANEVASRLLDGAVGQDVVVGPCLWQPSDGTAAKCWYFTVAVCGRNGFLSDRTGNFESARNLLRREGWRPIKNE